MKKTKKLFAFFMVLVLLVMPVSYAGADTPQLPKINFTVLGDSIASGYGLKNTLDCYAALISEEKSYYLTNDAVPGHTTENLLGIICNRPLARNDIEKSDLISISICGNDIIQFLQKADNTTRFDIMLNGINSKAVTEAVEKISHNLENICKEIRSLNADAPIIFQTQYNPLYANEQYSTYAPFAEKLVPVMTEVFDNLCKEFQNVYIADVYSAFDNYYNETGSYDVIQADGIHPSEKGHALIAETLLETIDELEKEGLVPVAAKYYYLLGDADQNSKISISDATTIQKIIAGLLIFRGDIAKLCLDADQNGDLNVKDATIIQKHLADLPSNQNIGTYIPYYG